MHMVVEDEQSFEGLIQHLQSAFQSGEMLGELMSDICSHTQNNETLRMCSLMTCWCWHEKIIALKESFHLEGNHQLKATYMHNF